MSKPVFTHSVDQFQQITQDMLRIAKEASEQCLRHDIPIISPQIMLQDWLDNVKIGSNILYCDEHSKNSVDNMKKDKTYILVGPEGGFSMTESNIIKKHSCTIATSLGHNIFKTDTACMSGVLSAINLLK